MPFVGPDVEREQGFVGPDEERQQGFTGPAHEAVDHSPANDTVGDFNRRLQAQIDQSTREDAANEQYKGGNADFLSSLSTDASHVLDRHPLETPEQPSYSTEPPIPQADIDRMAAEAQQQYDAEGHPVADEFQDLAGVVKAPAMMASRAGKGFTGLWADIGEASQTTDEEMAAMPYSERFKNTLAGLRGEKKPIEATMENIKSPALQIPYKVASQGVETLPQLAAVMASGPASPAVAGYLFGLDDKGNFHPVQATIAAGLPVLGKVTGPLAEDLAMKLGVGNETALDWINASGRYASANAVLAAQQAAEILPNWSSMSDEEKNKAIVNSASNMLLNGLMSLGDFQMEKATRNFPDINRAAVIRMNKSGEIPAEIQPAKPTQKPLATVSDHIGAKLDEIKALLEQAKGNPNEQIQPTSEETQPQGGGNVPEGVGSLHRDVEVRESGNGEEGGGGTAQAPLTPPEGASTKGGSITDQTPAAQLIHQANAAEQRRLLEAALKPKEPNETVETSPTAAVEQPATDQSQGVESIHGDTETPETANAGDETTAATQPADTAPVGNDVTQKYKIGNSPQTYSMVEKLRQSEVEHENDEQPVRVRNDRTGEESVVLEQDLTPIKTLAPAEKSKGPSLDEQLLAAKLDPDVFPDAASKRAALKRQKAIEFGGMGGAVPSEFEHSQETPTSIKNAVVDTERAKRGLPSAVKPAKRGFGRVWDEAMAEIDQNPGAQDALISELKQKPRALTDREDAMILQRQIDLQNEYAKATRDLNSAYEAGDQEAVQRHSYRVAQFKDSLYDLYEIGKKSGTETGRGLNARKMMAFEDFSLTNMENELRAAKGGKPLTEQENEQIAKLQKRIEELENQVNQRESGQQERQSNRQSQQEHPEIIRDAERESRHGGKGQKTPEEAQSEATERLRKAAADDETTKEDLSGIIQQLAKAFVRQGIRERVPLVDAVHNVVKSIVPDMEWRDTMDAISGYGKFRELSKDEINVKLRDLKGQMQQAAKILDMMQGEPPAKTGFERRTPSGEESELIKAVNLAKKQFNIRTDSPRSLKTAVQSLKTRLENQISDLGRRLAENDYSKKPRVPTPMDEEALRLKSERDRLKEQFDNKVLQERLKQRSLPEKVQDALVKWSRGFLLSGPKTLAKLSAAAVLRLGITPIEEAVGAGFSKVFPSLAEKAQREGGFNVRAEAKALTEGFTKGMQDAWKTLKTGKSDLDVLYGKRGGLPPEAIDFLGHIHGALKAPVKRAEFARSFEKRAANLMRHGVDVSDPLVQTGIALDAYKDANRAIFMQDNRVVSAYKAGLARMGMVDKATGKVPLGAKTATTAANILLPIVKVPTNIVAESLQYATGLVTGSARLGMALRDGVNTLPPEKADLIMRELKKGSIGGAVMLLGYLAPQLAGGYYQQGQKRKQGDVDYGAVRVGGNDIARTYVHHPLIEAMQIGATAKRVEESKLNKHDQNTQGLGEGVIAAGLGLLEEVPFIGETLGGASKLLNPRERQSYTAELAKSRLVPQAISWMAEQQDKDAKGNLIKRNPKGVAQGIESGIPRLRESVPQKKH